MSASRRVPDRIWLVVTGLLLVTMPALTLLVAYAILAATQSVVVGQITAVEAIELYLVEVAAFAVFGYLLYRLTLYASGRVTDTVVADSAEQGGGVQSGVGGRDGDSTKAQ